MKKYSKKHVHFLIKKSKNSQKKKNRNRLFRRLNAHVTSTQLKKNYNTHLEDIRKINQKVIFPIKPPNNLCMLTNTIEVLSFINKLKAVLNGKQFIKKVEFHLEDISNIEIGSILLLLSVVEEFSTKGIPCSGNLPKDEKCLKIFRQSGFLSHMNTISGSKNEMMESDNVILKRGTDKLNGEKTGIAIKKAIYKLTGKEAHYQPVYGIIGEININSIEHAYKKNKYKHWFFSIYHDQFTNKIICVFADNGIGIVKTLNRKIPKQIFESMKLTTEGDILYNAFLKKYGSRFEQPNRNRGLPIIKNTQDNNYINNLIVITNGVFLNLQNNEQIILPLNHSGTFYYWEFDRKCVDLYNNDKKNEL